MDGVRGFKVAGGGAGEAEVRGRLPYPPRGRRRAGFEEPAQHGPVQALQWQREAGLPDGEAAAGALGEITLVAHGGSPRVDRA
jgi:hypothetical protein